MRWSGKATLRNLETGKEISVKTEEIISEIKKIMKNYKNF